MKLSILWILMYKWMNIEPWSEWSKISRLSRNGDVRDGNGVHGLFSQELKQSGAFRIADLGSYNSILLNPVRSAMQLSIEIRESTNRWWLNWYRKSIGEFARIKYKDHTEILFITACISCFNCDNPGTQFIFVILTEKKN